MAQALEKHIPCSVPPRRSPSPVLVGLINLSGEKKKIKKINVTKCEISRKRRAAAPWATQKQLALAARLARTRAVAKPAVSQPCGYGGENRNSPSSRRQQLGSMRAGATGAVSPYWRVVIAVSAANCAHFYSICSIFS